MKKLIFLPLLLLLTNCATYLISDLGEIKKDVKINNDKAALYIKSNSWMVETFNNAESVIQFSDKDAGIIIGRYLLFTTVNSSYGRRTPTTYTNIYCIIKIQVKNNVARILITPEKWKYKKSYLKSSPEYTSEEAKQDIDKLITEFETYIQNDKSLDFYND